MLEVLGGILVNLVSDVIFLFLTVAVGWIFLVRTRRNRLLEFYRINDSRRLVVYMSNLNIALGGAAGIDGQPRSYRGPAVALGEMQVAARFTDLFNYPIPSLADSPGALSKLLISDVQVELLPSPPPSAQQPIEPSSSFITLGSPAYNTASQFVESSLNSEARFQEHGPAMVIDGVPPIADGTYGFVERIVDENQERHIFYAAGLSVLGTVGAAYFLLTEWPRLHKKPGDFVIMLRFDPTDYRRWSVVFER